MWTKGQIIAKAFGELALAGFVVDISPEEQIEAGSTMDTMMAEWEAKGIRIGYAFSSGPDADDASMASGLPDSAVRAVYCSLAVALAPSYGKQLAQTTKAAAASGYRLLLGQAVAAIAKQGQQQPTTLPVGAGSRLQGRTYPFFPPPTVDPLPVSNGAMTISPE